MCFVCTTVAATLLISSQIVPVDAISAAPVTQRTLTSYEANAVLSYSGNGYININYYARGLHETEGEIALAVARQVVLHNPELFDEAIENYSENETWSDGELSAVEEQEAIYRYIDANGPKVMEAFRAGKTEEAETAKRSIERLDAVIDKAPATF